MTLKKERKKADQYVTFIYSFRLFSVLSRLKTLIYDRQEVMNVGLICEMENYSLCNQGGTTPPFSVIVFKARILRILIWNLWAIKNVSETLGGQYVVLLCFYFLFS